MQGMCGTGSLEVAGQQMGSGLPRVETAVRCTRQVRRRYE